MRILLTGASSPVGKCLFNLLVSQGHHVVGVSRGPKLHPSFICADLENERVADNLPNQSFDVLMHFASYVPLIEKHSVWQDCSRVNLHGTARLLQWADGRIGKVILASSCAVYGETTKPVDEGHHLRPVTAYAVSKYGQEQILQAFCRARSLPLLILRLGYIYGAGMPEERVVISFIKKILLKEQIILRNSKTTGMNLIHQDDVARITAELISGGRGIFNLGSSEFVSLQDYIETAMLVVGHRTEIKYLNDPDANPTGHFLSGLKEAFKLEPNISLQKGIGDLIRYVK